MASAWLLLGLAFLALPAAAFSWTIAGFAHAASPEAPRQRSLGRAWRRSLLVAAPCLLAPLLWLLVPIPARRDDPFVGPPWRWIVLLALDVALLTLPLRALVATRAPDVQDRRSLRCFALASLTLGLLAIGFDLLLRWIGPGLAEL